MTATNGGADAPRDVEGMFFDALATGRLALPWCDPCDEGQWPPRSHCCRCYGGIAAWRRLSGEGSVYSFSVVHRGDPSFPMPAPYVLAYVRLEEGPIVLANIAGNETDDVHVGARVRLTSQVAPPVRGLVFDLVDANAGTDVRSKQ